MTTITNQQLFERVFRFILAQGKPGTRGGMCAYLGEDGSRCAVGCLLKTDEASNAIARGLGGGYYRNSSVSPLLDVEPEPGREVEFDKLLSDLQCAHDYAKTDVDWSRQAGKQCDGQFFIACFRQRMGVVARNHHLTIPEDLKS